VSAEVISKLRDRDHRFVAMDVPGNPAEAFSLLKSHKKETCLVLYRNTTEFEEHKVEPGNGHFGVTGKFEPTERYSGNKY